MEPVIWVMISCWPAFLSLLAPTGIQLTCVIPREVASQQRRFPQINWVQGVDQVRLEAIKACDLWLGVGGPAFSVAHKGWLLKHMEQDLDWCRQYDKPAALLGVNAEQTLLSSIYRGLATKVLSQFNWVVTRDQSSVEILAALDDSRQTELVVGMDLANFYLSGIVPAEEDKRRLAICHWEEIEDKGRLQRLRATSRALVADGWVVTFFGNDVRPDFDRRFYKHTFSWLDRSWLHPRIPFRVPDYRRSSLEELIQHYRRVGSVMSSRYHALLLAAWLGQHPVALGTRPKVVSLAEELQIPLVRPPWSVSTLREALTQAGSRRTQAERYFEERAQSMRRFVDALCSPPGVS